MKASIYLAGCDGCGKTSHLKSLVQVFASKNIPTCHIWIRSPKILSKPLMAYCRFVGLTHYRLIDGIRVGKHDFYRSPWVSFIFPYLQLIDMYIKIFLEIILSGKYTKKHLVFDRYALDTLADLMVDTQRYNLHKTWVGKMLIKMIPVNTITFIIDANENIIRERKDDVKNDPLLKQKLMVYRLLSKKLGIKIIDNNRPFNIVHRELVDLIKKS